MKILEYQLKFNTPAFLGNAEQAGQWRTPPIKALLRQWWRVAYAAERRHAVNVGEMRREEGLLFGNAWLENDFRKSQVRVRLDRWDPGKLSKQDWLPLSSVAHPEVPRAVGSDLYLGYGPVTLPRGAHQPTLKANAAIQAGEFATLSLAAPEATAFLIERALWLMGRYGALGGRSRNGWGSFALLPLPAGKGWGEVELPLRPWRDCLSSDWPHAIGQDGKGALIWQTPPYDDWKALMKRLAEIKIGMRCQFVFPKAAPDGHIHQRHWLSYPVTRHNVRDWDRAKLRLPNTLRFKVRPTGDGKLVGVIFHVPHLPPGDFHPHPHKPTITSVWQQVHAYLDEAAQRLARSPE